MIFFKDISRWQGNYNMDNPDPAIAIKMSGGDDGLYYDSQATNNYNHAVATGKVPIGYHFAGAKDPVAEADFFLRAMSPLAENDVLALDWEVGHPNPPAWCDAFIERVRATCGNPNQGGLLYLNRSTLQAHDWSVPLSKWGLWLAAPDVSFDADISGAGVYVAQQGPIVNGVDTDAFFGTIEQLKAYGYHAPAAPVVEPATVAEPVPVVAPAPVVEPVVVPEPVLPDPGTVITPEAPAVAPVEPIIPPVDSPAVGWVRRFIDFLVKLFGIK